MTSHFCAKCGCPIEEIGGAWVVLNTGTTADGLSYCPPNPDAARVGDHRPLPNRHVYHEGGGAV